jgi:hypothetical protein
MFSLKTIKKNTTGGNWIVVEIKEAGTHVDGTLIVKGSVPQTFYSRTPFVFEK